MWRTCRRVGDQTGQIVMLVARLSERRTYQTALFHMSSATSLTSSSFLHMLLIVTFLPPRSSQRSPVIWTMCRPSNIICESGITRHACSSPVMRRARTRPLSRCWSRLPFRTASELFGPVKRLLWEFRVSTPVCTRGRTIPPPNSDHRRLQSVHELKSWRKAFTQQTRHFARRTHC